MKGPTCALAALVLATTTGCFYDVANYWHEPGSHGLTTLPQGYEWAHRVADGEGDSWELDDLPVDAVVRDGEGWIWSTLNTIEQLGGEGTSTLPEGMGGDAQQQVEFTDSGPVIFSSDEGEAWFAAWGDEGWTVVTIEGDDLPASVDISHAVSTEDGPAVFVAGDDEHLLVYRDKRAWKVAGAVPGGKQWTLDAAVTDGEGTVWALLDGEGRKVASADGCSTEKLGSAGHVPFCGMTPNESGVTVWGWSEEGMFQIDVAADCSSEKTRPYDMPVEALHYVGPWGASWGEVGFCTQSYRLEDRAEVKNAYRYVQAF